MDIPVFWIMVVAVVAVAALFELGVFNTGGAHLPVFNTPTQPSKFLSNFTEAGLPNGTDWSVAYAGNTAYSTVGSIAFTTTSGNYSYSAGNISIGGCVYAADNAAGWLTAGFSKVLNYTVSGCVTTFTESGLPPGMNWSVSFDNVNRSSTNSSIQFFVGIGSFYYLVGSPRVNGCLYTPSPSSGKIASGSSQSIIYYGSGSSCP